MFMCECTSSEQKCLEHQESEGLFCQVKAWVNLMSQEGKL